MNPRPWVTTNWIIGIKVFKQKLQKRDQYPNFGALINEFNNKYVYFYFYSFLIFKSKEW
jgi:hypothetical protein